MHRAAKTRPDELLKVAKAYLNGTGCEENVAEAMKHFIMAEELGSCDAAWELGTIYCEGSIVEECSETAFGYFKKAAKAGHVYSQVNVGVAYREGDGVEQDLWEQMAQHTQDLLILLTYLHYQILL